jgi:hypothetical protein
VRCRRPLILASVVAVAAVSLLAAGCGGGSSPSGVASVASSTTAATTTPTQDGAVAYTNCMRSHGVHAFPDPTSGGEIPKVSLQQLGVSNSQFQAAQQACRSLWPTVSAAQQRQISAQALRFSRCVRNHGITEFPDPDSNGGIRIPDSVENTPGYGAALNACKPFPPPPNQGPPGRGN